MSLRTIVLFVKDVPRIATFYRDGLGLAARPATSSEGWVELDAGAGVVLGLHAIPPAIAATITISDPPVAREDSPLKLAFGVDDLEAARARLVELGGVMSEPNPWGACDGTDPEGNVFQIARN